MMIDIYSPSTLAAAAADDIEAARLRSLSVILTRGSVVELSSRDAPGRTDVCDVWSRCSCSVRTASTRLAVFEKSSPVQHIHHDVVSHSVNTGQHIITTDNIIHYTSVIKIDFKNE